MIENDYRWCVYAHINKINKKKYIGVTKHDPEKRWKKGKGYKNSPYFYNAILKYGWENFDHLIIYSGLKREDAYQKEKDLILFLKTKTPNGYNVADGGEVNCGIKQTEESKIRRREVLLKLWDEEYKKQVSIKRKNPNSPYQSKEFREKISKLVSGKNNPNYGNYWTEEQKTELSKKQKNNPMYKRGNNPNAKRIMCVETKEVFECIQDAVEKYNVKSPASFSIALNKPNRTAAKKHWITL